MSLVAVIWSLADCVDVSEVELWKCSYSRKFLTLVKFEV